MIAEINGLDKNELTKKYMELPIKNKREIVLDGNEIAKILNIKPSRQIKIIIEDLEKKIIYGEIENNKNSSGTNPIISVTCPHNNIETD
jgi:hypothetical protein